MVSIKEMLELSNTELSGLDIGSGSVKLVRLSRCDNGWRAVCGARVNIDTDIEDPQQVHENITAAVNKCFEICGSSAGSRHVVCGLSGHNVMVRGFSFPPMPPDVVSQAVALEAQQLCPFDVSKSVVDHQLIESRRPEASASRGVMAVVANQAVESRLACVADAGAKTVLMDVNGLALLNCLTETQTIEPSTSTAVIEAGNRFTSVVILGRDGIPFIRDLSCAADSVIRQTAETLRISHLEIRQKLHGLSDNKDTDGKIRDSFRRACRKLISDISETLRYYGLQQNASPVKTVFVCGGLAMVDEFIDMLNENLAEKITVLNPFTKISYRRNCPGGELFEKCGPAMAVAAGLAMRSL